MDELIVRLHVGNISHQLAQNSAALEQRLSRYGEIIKPIELHSKPVGDFYFGYMTMKLTPKELEKLKTSFNKVLFMGRKISISVAKPWYQERLKERNQVDYRYLEMRDKVCRSRAERIKEAQTAYPMNNLSGELLLRNQYAANCSSMGYLKSCHTFNNTSANTKSTPPSHNLVGRLSYGALTNASYPSTHQYSRISGGGEVIKGRHLKSKRKPEQLRKQTRRILVNGELKQLKQWKTKLWGLEKNKSPLDLTWRYHNGSWWSGTNHIIENTSIGQNVDFSSDEEAQEERNKNSSVMEKFLAEHDFSKPIDLSDKDDDLEAQNDKNDFDYEIQGKTLAQEPDHETEETNELPPSPNADNEAKPGATETDIRPNNARQDYDITTSQVSISEKSTEPVGHTNPQSHQVNATDTLRAAFNPTEKFLLNISDDDIDESKVTSEEEQRKILDNIKKSRHDNGIVSGYSTSKKFGLFWPHTDSAFLHSLSQLLKLGTFKSHVKLPGENTTVEISSGEEPPYEKWFWSIRGEFSAECKRRRRDTLRSFKKRKNNSFV